MLELRRLLRRLRTDLLTAVAALAACAGSAAAVDPDPCQPLPSCDHECPGVFLEFAAGSAELSGRTRAYLADLVGEARAKGDVVALELVGTGGMDEGQPRLGEKRAKAVARELERGGVKASELEVRGRVVMQCRIDCGVVVERVCPGR